MLEAIKRKNSYFKEKQRIISYNLTRIKRKVINEILQNVRGHIQSQLVEKELQILHAKALHCNQRPALYPMPHTSSYAISSSQYIMRARVAQAVEERERQMGYTYGRDILTPSFLGCDYLCVWWSPFVVFKSQTALHRVSKRKDLQSFQTYCDSLRGGLLLSIPGTAQYSAQAMATTRIQLPAQNSRNGGRNSQLLSGSQQKKFLPLGLQQSWDSFRFSKINEDSDEDGPKLTQHKTNNVFHSDAHPWEIHSIRWFPPAEEPCLNDKSQ